MFRKEEQPRLTAQTSDTCRAMEGNVGSITVLLKDSHRFLSAHDSKILCRSSQRI